VGAEGSCCCRSMPRRLWKEQFQASPPERSHDLLGEQADQPCRSAKAHQLPRRINDPQWKERQRKPWPWGGGGGFDRGRRHVAG